jgi:hypothetical protein
MVLSIEHTILIEWIEHLPGHRDFFSHSSGEWWRVAPLSRVVQFIHCDSFSLKAPSDPPLSKTKFSEQKKFLDKIS